MNRDRRMSAHPRGRRTSAHPCGRRTSTSEFVSPWPESPPAGDEQGELPLGDTTLARYRAWRATEDGEQVWLAIHARARNLVMLGDEWVGVKCLVEDARRQLRIKINNSFTAYLARDLTRDPMLKDAIKLRARK